MLAAAGCASDAREAANPTTIAPAAPAHSVPLRSGAKPLNETISRRFIEQVAASGDGLHGIALLVRPPTAEDRDALSARGITLLSRITRYHYFVRARPGATFADTTVTARVRAWTGLEARDRVAPAVWRASAGMASPDARRDAAIDRAQREDGMLDVVVRIHADAAVADARDLLTRHARSQRAIDSTRWRVVADGPALRQIAASDMVRWIDEPPRPAVADMDLVREQIHVNAIQDIDAATGVVTGAAGAGIRVGVHDVGIHGEHPDFTDAGGVSRIVIDDPLASSHGTAVAGVIAGSGKQSGKPDSWGLTWGRDGTIGAYAYAGMAPLAELIDAPRADGPGFEAIGATALLEHITKHGLDLSNHAYSFEVNGQYSNASVLHDRWIRGHWAPDGTAIPGRLHVHSAGNFGVDDGGAADQWQRGYFSLGTQLKNALVVGNYFPEGSITSRYSSFGPAHDGRIKPDVVAPGSLVWTTGYCTEDDPLLFLRTRDSTPERVCPEPPGPGPRTGFYYAAAGSSIAAAVTSGMLALVLGEFVKGGEDLDVRAPRPSTLRAIAVHSAVDLTAPPAGWRTTHDGYLMRPTAGPDFVTGYGVVDAERAVDIARRNLVNEGMIGATCQTKQYRFQVPADASDPVRVTLAWDDTVPDGPEAASTVPLLVNDLDLVLIDPNLTRHYPWQLDQEILDDDGSPLASDQQPCGTSITVRRLILPSLTETPLGTDVIDPAAFCVVETVAGLCAARRGPDHLNNLEQVVAVHVPGMWTAEVSGFMIETGPQPFSLIGIDRQKILTFEPQFTCSRYALLCPRIFANLCVRYPPLCAEPRVIPMLGDSLVLRFAHRDDRGILQLSALCLMLDDARACGDPRARDGPRVLTLRNAGSVGVEMVSARGESIAADFTRATTKTLRAPADRGEIFVVLRPLGSTTIGRSVRVPVLLR